MVSFRSITTAFGTASGDGVVLGDLKERVRFGVGSFRDFKTFYDSKWPKTYLTDPNKSILCVAIIVQDIRLVRQGHLLGNRHKGIAGVLWSEAMHI